MSSLVRPKAIIALTVLCALVSVGPLHWREHAHADVHAEAVDAHHAGHCHHHCHQHTGRQSTDDDGSPSRPHHHHDHDCEICSTLAQAAPLTQCAVVPESLLGSCDALLLQGACAESLDAPVLPGRGPPGDSASQILGTYC